MRSQQSIDLAVGLQHERPSEGYLVSDLETHDAVESLVLPRMCDSLGLRDEPADPRENAARKGSAMHAGPSAPKEDGASDSSPRDGGRCGKIVTSADKKRKPVVTRLEVQSTPCADRGGGARRHQSRYSDARDNRRRTE